MSYVAHFVPETLTRADLDASRGAWVLEFGTNWCGHCQRAQPAIEAALLGRALTHVKIEDGPGRRLGRSFGVKLWPTLVMLQDGQEVARVVRPTLPEDLTTALAALR